MLNIDKPFRENRDKTVFTAKTKATEMQWYLVNAAINAFIKKYPKHWMEFQNQLKQERTKWQLAKEGDLKKANFRTVVSFPTIEDENGKVIDSLKPVLEKFIPKLTDKKSVNLKEFLRRYPYFKPGEFEGTSKY